MAEFEDLQVKLKIKADSSGLSDTADEAKKAGEEIGYTANKAKQFAENMSKVEAFTLKLQGQTSRLAALLNSEKVDAGAIGKSVLGIKTTLSQIEKINPKERGLVEAITPEQAANMAKMATEADILAIKVRNASEKLAQLYNSGASSSELTKAVDNVRRLTKQLEALQKATEDASKASNEAERVDLGSGAEVQFDAPTSKVSAFVDKLRDLVNVGSKLSSLAGAAGYFGRALGKGADIARGAINKLTSAFAHMTSQGKKTTSFLSTLIASVKRIMFYRMIRTAIREIGQAFKEGVDNVYQWSKALGGDFASTMDRLATSVLYLKNSLGAMVSPLITALAPAIEYIIDRFVVLINVINQFIAAITGAGTWTKAIKYPKEYAKAAGAAADKAKQFGLATIDQLTVLSKASSASGGSGAVDYSKMFETVELKGGIWDKIKDMIAKGEWRELGKLLASEMNKLIEGWDAEAWGKKFGKAINNGIEFAYGFLSEANFKQIGSKIASFLNGALGEINTDTLGRTLVRVFTGAFDFLVGFIETFDWNMLGTKIHDFIIGALSEFTEWASTLDWEKLGSDLASALENTLTGLRFGEIINAMFNALGVAFNAVCTTVSSFISATDWEAFGGSIYDTIKSILTDLKFSQAFEAMFEAAGTAFGAVVKTVDGFFKAGWDDLKEYFDKKMKENGGNVVKAFIEGILDEIDAILGFETWIDQNIGEPFENGVKKVFGMEEGDSKVMDNLGEQLSRGLINGILNALPWYLRPNWITDIFHDPIVDKLKEVFGIASPSTVMYDIGVNIVQGMINGISETWQTLTSDLQQKWEMLKGWWGSLSFPEFHIPKPHFNVSGGFGWNGSGFDFPEISVDWYANGGFPTPGELFIANEAGAELVGSMNGRTAVANNQEIVAGIEQGVYSAMTAAMRNGGFVAQVYLDGKQISGTVVKNVNSETRRTGKSPLIGF